ncbi:MAG TPA: CHASE2 domain-containing protein [Nostocaceae cyanobacterium]|nr:CHASE2 domain-containing protein [Nostocaceae cyanobacterium]
MQNPNSRFRSFSQALLSFGGNVLITSVVISGAIIGLRHIGLLEGLELGAYDQMMRSRPDAEVDNRFLIVEISEDDVQTRKEYPIHDGTLAQLLTKLEENEPRVIGVDVLRDVPQGPPQGRVELERVISESDRIVTVCKMSSPDNPGVRPAPGTPDELVGFADIPVDAGGILRRNLLTSTPVEYTKSKLPDQHICNDPNPDNQLVSFSLQMVILYLQKEENPILAEPAEKNKLKFGKVVLEPLIPTSGGYSTITTSDYQILVNYRSNQKAVKIVSLSDVLANRVSAEDIRDKVVMIGYTSQQAKDDFYTPYSGSVADNQKMPGVVIHAQNASQIISAVLDGRPLFWFWPDWQEGLWIFSWTLVGATLAWFIRNPWLLVVTSGLSIVVLVSGSFFLFTQAGWIPLVPPLLGILGSATVVLLMDRYAATIVKTVKGFLKINVDIDEAKKAEEVAAITESDYFLDLQDKIQDLRTNKGEKQESIPTVRKPTAISNTNGNGYVAQTSTPNRNRRTTQVSLDVDYLEIVRERRRQRENPDGKTNNLEVTDSSGLTQDDFGFIDQIQQRGKQMRQGKTKQ